jgi:hypothetical protein
LWDISLADLKELLLQDWGIKIRPRIKRWNGIVWVTSNGRGNSYHGRTVRVRTGKSHALDGAF